MTRVVHDDNDSAERFLERVKMEGLRADRDGKTVKVQITRDGLYRVLPRSWFRGTVVIP